MKRILMMSMVGVAATALAGCDEDQYREDATEMCTYYESVSSGTIPYSDIYAAQYGRAGSDADLTGDGFINYLELQKFCLDLQAQGYTLGGGSGGGSPSPTNPDVQLF